MSINMPLSFTVYSHSPRLRAHCSPMSDRRAEYPEDYQRSAERRPSVPQAARDAEGGQRDPYEQRDPYAQPPYAAS